MMTEYKNDTMNEIGSHCNKELIVFKIYGKTIDDKTEVMKYIVKRFKKKCNIYSLYDVIIEQEDSYLPLVMHGYTKITEDTDTYPINSKYFVLDYRDIIKNHDGLLDSYYIGKLYNTSWNY